MMMGVGFAHLEVHLGGDKESELIRTFPCRRCAALLNHRALERALPVPAC